MQEDWRVTKFMSNLLQAVETGKIHKKSKIPLNGDDDAILNAVWIPKLNTRIGDKREEP